MIYKLTDIYRLLQNGEKIGNNQYNYGRYLLNCAIWSLSAPMNGSGQTVVIVPSPAEKSQFPPANLFICKLHTRKETCQIMSMIKSDITKSHLILKAYVNLNHVCIVIKFDKSFEALSLKFSVTFCQDIVFDLFDGISNISTIRNCSFKTQNGLIS